MESKTKIVLDADVIIHFIKGERFVQLLDIFPEYEYLILDVVYNEVTVSRTSKTQIDNTLNFMKRRISQVKFDPKGESRLEYAKLISTLGRGESACMVYCRDNHNVLGSSNLKDIKDYCQRNRITYLTTLDFLYHAFIRGKMTAAECNRFIIDVNSKRSKLPVVDITTYVPTCRL
ncbi:MAG: hypothetical protein K2L05_03205 [Muribaculaceae bacterium]|nr:hypothetical protein [Muribaculaceae bacterium]